MTLTFTLFRGLMAMMNNRAREKYGVNAETKEDENIRQTNDELRQKLRQKDFLQSSTISWDCPICSLPGRERSSLRCGHVLCPECAKRSVETSNKCPFCQQPAAISEIRKLYFQWQNLSYFFLSAYMGTPNMDSQLQFGPLFFVHFPPLNTFFTNTDSLF